MAFMEMEILRKGTLCVADCAKCGATLHAHEFASWNFNDNRDAMQAGTLRCDDCGGRADASTFHQLGRKQYAGRYSASGYLDCTDWSYDSNLRRLQQELRSLYGDTE
jgi:DNA-directed RNA polymerase subunit RPC12/RpoP